MPTVSAGQRSISSIQQHPGTLARRLLFPSLPLDQPLPPLLTSLSAHPDLNCELYDFIALALRAYVNPWWTKITRYDKQFLPDITRLLTIVIRNLETRILAADPVALVFCDIPTLITQHYRDYRNAASKLSTSYASGAAISLPQLFHQSQPHIAVSADGVVNEEYIRQILNHVLKTCLPPEDYEPEAERLIIREVMLKILLHDMIPQITQPWFIFKTILDHMGPPDSTQTFKPSPTSAPAASSNFSFHVLLILVLSAIQSVSGAGLAIVHAYKQALSTIKLVKTELSPPPQSPTPSTSTADIDLASLSDCAPKSPAMQSQNLARPALGMLSEIFTVSSRHASSLLMTAVAMGCSAFTVFLNRLLPYLLAQIISPSFLTLLVASAKHTLFPHGYPLPPPPDPLPEEQAAIRESLVTWRPTGVLGSFVAAAILGTEGEGKGHRRATVEAALEPLECRECNVHLAVLLLDRITLSLWPELAMGSSVEG